MKTFFSTFRGKSWENYFFGNSSFIKTCKPVHSKNEKYGKIGYIDFITISLPNREW